MSNIFIKNVCKLKNSYEIKINNQKTSRHTTEKSKSFSFPLTQLYVNYINSYIITIKSLISFNHRCNTFRILFMHN